MPTSIKIKPSVMSDESGEEVVIDGDGLTKIIDKIAERNPGKIGRNELSSLALSRTRDRSDASSWVEALADIVGEKGLLTTEPVISEPVGIEELTRAALTRAVIEDEPEADKLTPQQAADEVARLASHPKSGIDMVAAARATLRTPGLPEVGFTDTRMYDEPVSRSAEDSEDEILRLTTTGRGAAYCGNAEQPVTGDDDEVLRLTSDPALAAMFASTEAASDLSQATHGNAAPHALCKEGHRMPPGAGECPECGSGPRHVEPVDGRSADEIVADSLSRNESYFGDSRQMADSSGNRVLRR